jgi:hypothetical protein
MRRQRTDVNAIFFGARHRLFLVRSRNDSDTRADPAVAGAR